MVLTMVELTTTVVIGSLPGISSVFTRKYVYGSAGRSTREWTGRLSRVLPTQLVQQEDSHIEFDFPKNYTEIRVGSLEL